MLLFVGLGNPGTEYEGTRHNIGFAIIDAIASASNARNLGSKFKAEIFECVIAGQKCLLAKPMSYMNNSGVPAQSTSSFYKIPLSKIIVFHDEIDLALGKIRIKTGGSDNGHNGLKSLDSHLGKEYKRVRFGVGRPAEEKIEVSDYVLGKFTKAENEVVDKVVESIASNIDLLAEGKDGIFMNKISMVIKPPRAKLEKKEIK